MFKFLWPLLRRLSLGGLLCLLLIAYPTIGSEAASLYHTHTDSCREEIVKICSDHYTRECTAVGDLYCLRCEKNNYGILIAQKYNVCGKGLMPDKGISAHAICGFCGEYISYDESGVSSHEYTEKVVTCGFPEQGPVANVDISVDSTAWTNGEVTLCVNSSNVLPGVELSYTWSGLSENGSTAKVSENGTYAVTISSNAGAPVVLSATVGNIDKINPVLGLNLSTGEWTENGLRIIAEASDNESGLCDKAFSFNGGEYVASNEFEIKNNGTYSVTVKDKAGNQTTKTVEVTNIGRDPKVVAAEQEALRRAEAERAAAQAEAERQAAERAKAEKAAAEEARIQAEAKQKQAEAEAVKAKAEKEKAKAEKEKAKAEKEKAIAEKEKAVAELEKAETELRMAEIEAGKSAEEVPDTPQDNGGGDLLGREADGNLTETEGYLIPVVEMPVSDEGGTLEKEPRDSSDDKLDEERNEPNDEPDYILIDEPKVPASKAQGFEDTGDNINIGGYRTLTAGSDYLTGENLLKAGILLAIIGTFILSLFSYVYVSENGKKRIVARAKIQKDGNRIIARVPAEKLKSGDRYSLYISTWRYSDKKRYPIYVMTGEKEGIINVDEGKNFVFH